jgi:dTDP-4-dehydrorhamnose reductase
VAFPEADARDRASFDLEDPPELGYRPDLVLHTAAWTDVDGAESTPAEAVRANVRGTRNVVALGAPVVYYSTDYVFDGRKGEPYLESDEPNPLSVYGRTKLEGEREVRDGWVVRSPWLFGPTGRNFLLTMLDLGKRQEEVSVVDDQRGSPTFVGHLAEATKAVLDLPYGTYHLAAEGEATWAEFAEAIFEEAGIECRVRRITTAEFPRDAERPAYSVLRSERGAPMLPHWREGLRAALERLGAAA